MPDTWQQKLQRGLLQAWTHRGLVSHLLWPLSLLYRLLTWMHRLAYALGVTQVRRVPAVVIVVGNVVAGGAGKTPTVMALVQHLRARNLQVGVISRGYGRAEPSSCLEVQTDSQPHSVGDEPLLIRRTTQVPVFVAPTRYVAAMALLARYPQTQIVVCDDGLQHYALYRDLEVCVFDDRGIGNNRQLPAGPLREPWPRTPLARAGQRKERLLVLHTGSHPAFAGYTANRALANFATRRDGTQVALDTLTQAGEKPLLAVAGIAQPESFFAMLRAISLPLVQTMALPDHYDFHSFPHNIYEGYRIICTEKDAAKLWLVAPDALAVPLQFEPDPAFFTALDATLSSPHGHKTS
ncbi:MAG: tetraacyldisaccharide 4'-kinase [Rhodoferax sp.]|jgi:tetraacyldisaccharide 4'-kinase